MPHLLGIDVGTSGTKAVVTDGRGKTVATATVPHTLLTPRVGWTEQEPDEWWRASCKAVRQALRKANVKKGDVGCIGLSGQMHGSVFLDKQGRVLRPALLWNDQRTAAESLEILEKVGGPRRMLDLVGNLPLTGYTVPKLVWFRKHEGKKAERLAHLLLPKDYVRLKLTGEYATDVGDASGTAMLDVRSRAWSGDLLSTLGIDRDILPSVHESTDITGHLTKDAADALGLADGTPVIAGGGDVMTAAVGNGIVEPGLINANLGTGGVVCAHSETPAVDDKGDEPGRIATMCHAVPGKYVVFGCMLSAAGSLQWYADELARAEAREAGKNGDVFDVLLKQAEAVSPGSEGLYFLPYLTGERCPHNNPSARGAWVGLSRKHTRGHLVRSLIEGVTYNMTQMLDIMRNEMNVPARQIRATGGGAKSQFWLALQADVYQAPVALTTGTEGSGYGAALLAGVGCGTFKSVEEACRANIRTETVVKPRKKFADLYARRMPVYAGLYSALSASFSAIDNADK